MPDTILVATDASEASNHAVDFAADMAARYEAELHLLHVVRDMQLPPAIAKMAEVEKISAERTSVMEFVADKILSDAHARAKAAGASAIQRAKAFDDPATAIMDYAASKRVDLIVMGTRGLGKVKGALLGSVSRKVVNLSSISCLIVR